MKEKFVRKIVIAAAAAALLLSAAACGKQQAGKQEVQEAQETKEEKEEKEESVRAFIDVLEDGSIVASFERTEKGTGGGTGFTIEEGEYLLIETDLTEGRVHGRVFSGGSDIEAPPTGAEETPAAVDFVFEGAGKTEYRLIQPGNYVFSVNVEEKATGTISVSKRTDPTESAAEADTAAVP